MIHKTNCLALPLHDLFSSYLNWYCTFQAKLAVFKLVSVGAETAKRLNTLTHYEVGIHLYQCVITVRNIVNLLMDLSHVLFGLMKIEK